MSGTSPAFDISSPAPGIPPPVWYQIIQPCLIPYHSCLVPHHPYLVPHHPCLIPHLCLVSHHMTGTPPLSGTPLCVWNPIPSPVWYPISVTLPHHLLCSTPPHLAMAAPIWPLTAPYPLIWLLSTHHLELLPHATPLPLLTAICPSCTLPSPPS